jgi:hypothetical protein
MWDPVQRYRALDRESQRLFWSAVILLPLVRLSLRLRGYNRTLRSLQKRLDRPGLEPIGPDVQKTSRMVRAALRHLPAKFTCLEESLVFWYSLRKQGISTQLRIGVRKTDGKFEAHAWVEHEGLALHQSDQMHRHYAAFDKEFSNPPAEKP